MHINLKQQRESKEKEESELVESMLTHRCKNFNKGASHIFIKFLMKFDILDSESVSQETRDICFQGWVRSDFAWYFPESSLKHFFLHLILLQAQPSQSLRKPLFPFCLSLKQGQTLSSKTSNFFQNTLSKCNLQVLSNKHWPASISRVNKQTKLTLEIKCTER